ncbi:CG43331, partial [Drosophila busckii]
KSCKIIYGSKFKKNCSGRFPHNIKRKYMDRITQIHYPYAIYNYEDETFLISFGRSAVTNEDEIVFDKGRFKKPGSKAVIDRGDVLTCLPYRFHFTEDLLEDC